MRVLRKGKHAMRDNGGQKDLKGNVHGEATCENSAVEDGKQEGEHERWGL